MKKTLLKLFLLTVVFLTVQNSFAQSFVSTSESVTIKIVDRISITVSEKLKENIIKEYDSGDFNNNTNRNLLVSYKGITGNYQNFSLLHLYTCSGNSTLTMGEQTELKNLAQNEHLHININKQNEIKELNSKHFVTIVY